MTLIVRCPTCQKNLLWDESNPYRPFCSKRCQLIDLGEWADESHKIKGGTVDLNELTEEEIMALEAALLKEHHEDSQY